MKEIGGYIELEQNHGQMLHEGAKALNCGTACLAYLIHARNINKIMLPLFLCDCIRNLCETEGVEIRFYNIGRDFLPAPMEQADDEWLYIVNFYGQITKDTLQQICSNNKHVIIDQAQAYFDEPVKGIDTVYTCRKFFGVPDGAFLYTDAVLQEKLSVDESFERMHYLLGRYERTASEFYSEYVANNTLLADEPIRRMSKLTDNLLHGIDYEHVKKIRTSNYEYLYNFFDKYNQLSLRKIEGAFAYPLLLHNGAFVRKELLKKNIYIPTLWPNVLFETDSGSIEYYYADNILPLPVDQRYDVSDMEFMIDIISNFLH